MAAAFIPSEYCHNCGTDRLRIGVVSSPSTGIQWCARCWEWHRQALLALSGKPPSGCQVCNQSYRELEQKSPNHDVRFKIVSKDGLFQVLCLPCAARYRQQARHRFKNTAFGHAAKLF